MRRSRTRRAGALVLMAACSAAPAGCIHNHHYYGANGLPSYTTTDVGPFTIGSVCEVPPRVVGGPIVAQAPAGAPAAAGSPAPRVVVSEPTRGGMPSWRRSDPEGSLATTRVEGGFDESVNR